MTQYGFYFDATRCTGCKTCEAACRDYHDLPLDLSYTNGPDLKDAIYTDEYQLAFSYAHIAEIRNKHKYHEISGVDTNLDEPLITADDTEK